MNNMPVGLPPLGEEQHARLSVQTIQRAAAILRCFSKENPELGLTHISQKTNIHKSTVSRLLLALQREGFVLQNPENGKWRLGLSLLSLAGVVLERMDLRKLSQVHLLALVAQTQETVNIEILDEDECVNIERIPSPKPIQYAGRIGRRTPLHCTASGEVFLAYLPPQQRDVLLPKTLQAYTKQTIVDRQVLESKLEQVRTQGYAVAHEEFEEGLTAIAAPIRDHIGRVVATVSVAGPSYRIGPNRIKQFIDPVLDTARKISNALGYVVLPKDLPPIK